MALKEIRVLHMDDKWEDVRVAEETQSTPVKGVAFPRELLSDVRKLHKEGTLEFPNLEVPGVYILIGRSETDACKVYAYIGESRKGVGSRLTQHDTSKKFPWWTDTIALIKKDERFNDGLVLYTESSLIRSARTNPCWEIQQNNPSENAGNLSPTERLLWQDIVPNLKKIIGALGWNIFRNFAEGVSLADQVTIPRTKGYPEFECKGNGYRARMYIVASDQFVVEEGSKARKETTGKIRQSIVKERKALVENRTLQEAASHLEFSKNHTFSSAWKAASVVSGRPIDGDNAWKSPDGKTTYGMWKSEQSTRSERRDVAAAKSLETVTVVEKGVWASPEFYYSGFDFDGTMQVDTSGKFVVKAGSKASGQTSPSTSKGMIKVRKELRDEGVLDKKYEFTRDHKFTSVSTSASAVRGQMKNGKEVWRLPNGCTYKNWLKDQETNSEEDDNSND